MTNSVTDEQTVEAASATTLKELKDTLWKAACLLPSIKCP